MPLPPPCCMADPTLGCGGDQLGSNGTLQHWPGGGGHYEDGVAAERGAWYDLCHACLFVELPFESPPGSCPHSTAKPPERYWSKDGYGRLEWRMSLASE